MRKILFLLVIVVAFLSCGNKTEEGVVVLSADNLQSEYVEVLYFHGKKRCVTCNTIEKLSKEVVQNDFANELKDGKIIFRSVDISTLEGENIADSYEVTWSSLFVNKWESGDEEKENMTDFAFSTAKNSPDVFKAGLKKKIEEELN